MIMDYYFSQLPRNFVILQMELCCPRRGKGARRMQTFQKLMATRGWLQLVKEATEERSLGRVREGLEEHLIDQGSEQDEDGGGVAVDPSKKNSECHLLAG
jgi:hypothetical protein